MARRFRALFLLLLSTMLFALQGQTVVQCLCSGQIALGNAPEPCCESCPSTASEVEVQMSAAQPELPAVAVLQACDKDCYHMAVAESDQPFPPASHVDAPLPTVALLAEDPAFVERALMLDPAPAWTREGLHRPAPLGPPCTILYGALLI